MAGIMLPVLFVTIVAVLLVVVGGTRVSARDVAWIAGTPGYSQAEADVYSRCLARHRRHRLIGGLFGTLLAFVAGIRLFGTVTLGVGGTNPLADLLFCSLAGVIFGAFSAESFRLSEPRSQTVSASLAERPGVSRPELIRAARGLSLASLLGGGLIAVTGNGVAPLGIAIGALIVTLAAEATQSAITGRRRPVLSDRAQVVDKRLRLFASSSIARLQLAAAVLAAAWTLAKAPGPDTGPLAVIQLIVVSGALLLTVILIHRASPRPSRKWIAEQS